jgi:hypothetical protein
MNFRKFARAAEIPQWNMMGCLICTAKHAVTSLQVVLPDKTIFLPR